MINLTCSGCGKTVEVPSLLAAANQNCPHCGKNVISGRSEETAITGSGPDAWEKAQQSGPGATSESTAAMLIKVLAIINFLFGAFHLCCGCGATLGSSYLVDPQIVKMLHERGVNDTQITQVRQYSALIGGGFILYSLAMIYAGVGVLKRSMMAWTVTLVLSGLAGVMALLNGFFGDCCSMMVYSGYLIVSLSICLLLKDAFPNP
jgi:galactitol-specific phosphotransferase system IIB component/predicted RNA-binding Zn-ribbon protein involved in translation (DUF1610 family)